jgi:hypothetical protein
MIKSGMSQKSKDQKSNYRDTSGDSLSDFLSKHERDTSQMESSSNNFTRNFLLISIFVVLGLYFVQDISRISLNPITSIVDTINFDGYSEDLLNSMNELMAEMGYTELTHEDLTELRDEGVTATYISNVRSLGFTDLTLDEAVRLANAGVSSTFMAMMIELGYDLTIDQFIELSRAEVTAYYTSNVHDLGYSDVTTEQLIRMQRIGVTPELIQSLQEEQGEDIPLEDIIRYRISNQ